MFHNKTPHPIEGLIDNLLANCCKAQRSTTELCAPHLLGALLGLGGGFELGVLSMTLMDIHQGGCGALGVLHGPDGAPIACITRTVCFCKG